MTLPKELEEEFDAIEEINRLTFCSGPCRGGSYAVEAMKSFLAKTYAAGVKAGLMEAMKEAPNRRGDGCIADELHYEMWNSCRTEFLSRLEKRLNDGVQE